jgi:hypothetical protein
MVIMANGQLINYARIKVSTIFTNGFGMNVRHNLNIFLGQHSFTIPSVLAAGDYLIRPEIIALHEGSKQGGAQLYMACVQFKVAGSGSKVSLSLALGDDDSGGTVD